MTDRAEEARRLDAEDPLAPIRNLYCVPAARDVGGERDGEAVYLTGNSLGLMPRAARDAVNRELDDWARLGVEGHFDAGTPWFSYHEHLREPLARLVGAKPIEVVAMNTLTVNLHLMMVSFYRPTRERYKILIEASAFPSDSHAVMSQAACHGYDPADAIIRMAPRAGEALLRTDDICRRLETEAASIALVLLPGVHYLTGQVLDIERISACARAVGVPIGWDLAHAAGNIPLRLHDWGPDFAAWCSYKYLNAGPGAIAGCFVHERHARRVHLGSWTGADRVDALPRFAGWWGNDPATRFRMEPHFTARDGADGWQLSNPPILSLAPLRSSLEIFDSVGLDRLREKSIHLTGILQTLLEDLASASPGSVRISTPREPSARGCQLSIHIAGSARAVRDALRARGVIVDFREPDVIRAAPVPMYNSYMDVLMFAEVLAETLSIQCPWRGRAADV